MYEVVVTPHAEREVRRLDRSVKNRILSAAAALSDNPRPPGSIKIKGEQNRWRIRVGDWRIGYEINDQAQFGRIVTVGHRREFYD